MDAINTRKAGPVDKLKTYPVQLAGTALSTATIAASVGLYDLAEQTPGTSVAQPLTGFIGAASVGLIGANIKIARKKSNLRSKTEGIFERRGYDERIVRAASKTWCGRQAVKMAAESVGYLDDFYKTINDPEYKKAFSWLPHI